MKKLKISSNKTVSVDDEDYDYLNQWKWSYTGIRGGCGYAIRYTSAKGGVKRKKIWMHRELMGNPNDLTVDHIDRDCLNNCKSNLRICTLQENLWNRKQNKGKSKYKGVSWDKEDKNWRVVISKGGMTYHLGRHKSEKDAAAIYNNKAKEIYGNFAYLNRI